MNFDFSVEEHAFIAGVREFLRAERERWGKLVKDIGLQPE